MPWPIEQEQKDNNDLQNTTQKTKDGATQPPTSIPQQQKTQKFMSELQKCEQFLLH